MEAESAALTAESVNMFSKASNISIASNIFKYGGTALTIGGFVLGVSLGAYFTHKFCEELIEKFADFYKKNISKIRTSYEKAEKYFSLEEEEEEKKVSDNE